MIVMAYINMIHGSYAAGMVFSTTPQSRNVSAGTMVEFTCAVPASGLTSFGITATPPVGSCVVDDINLPNGDRQVTLSFIAPSDQNSVDIVCCVVAASTRFNQSFAVLTTQGLLLAVGNLTSTEVDHCTLHFTWTAPYTLQGVPINYYTINITRHSDGAVLRSDTTNTTEYLYSVSSLGETLEVVMAAVNGAGTGNATSIMTLSPSSIREIQFISTLNHTVRTDSSTNTNWTYTFDFEETFVCGGAISHVTVEVCLNSSCSTTNGTVTMLHDGVKRVIATFTDLTENRINYIATLNINYNGGVVQQSQPVENISTFDVRNATCIEVAPHQSYTIIVTDDDDDAEEIINAAPVTIMVVSVPDPTATASATQDAVSFIMATTSPLPSINDVVSTIVHSTVAGLVPAILLMIVALGLLRSLPWLMIQNSLLLIIFLIFLFFLIYFLAVCIVILVLVLCFIFVITHSIIPRVH